MNSAAQAAAPQPPTLPALLSYPMADGGAGCGAVPYDGGAVVQNALNPGSHDGAAYALHAGECRVDTVRAMSFSGSDSCGRIEVPSLDGVLPTSQLRVDFDIYGQNYPLGGAVVPLYSVVLRGSGASGFGFEVELTQDRRLMVGGYSDATTRWTLPNRQFNELTAKSRLRVNRWNNVTIVKTDALLDIYLNGARTAHYAQSPAQGIYYGSGGGERLVIGADGPGCPTPFNQPSFVGLIRKVAVSGS